MIFYQSFYLTINQLLFAWSAPRKYVNHVYNVFVHIYEAIQYMFCILMMDTPDLAQ